MAAENCWRARKIQGELLKLGIRISLATISRYLLRETFPGEAARSAGLWSSLSSTKVADEYREQIGDGSQTL
jgi:hypothetical protein